jgi:pyruvate/2-oxoglutarate dehydrogenase complex dihydrolipoamide dehydrogenase (E3) component
MQSFDVVVVGAGPAGEVAAGRLADHGLEVAIVEDRLVGGECSFWACMPSKALLRPYEALAEVRRIPGAREAVTGELDVAAVLARRDEVIHDLDDSAQLPWLEDRSIKLFRGHGRLTGEPNQVEVGTELLHARRAVILAPGSIPKFPPIEGLDRIEDTWTNREATTTKEIPPRLTIIGGGVVGVECAQAFQTLGSQVTLVEGERHLLPREEAFACVQLSDSLTALGVEIRTGQKATKLSQQQDRIAITLSAGDTIDAHVLLVALGRTPATQDLGIQTLDLAPGEPIHVDRVCRVPGHEDWLYAVGDVNERALLTHMGKYQARLAADHILGHDHTLSHGADGPLAPRVVFTDPQVAAVGHTTRTAEQAGIEFDVYDVGTSANAGGSFYGPNAPGTARFVVDRERRIIVGATITGSEIADFLHAATIAVVGEVPLERLRHAVPVFPTRSEIWLNLLTKAGV